MRLPFPFIYVSSAYGFRTIDGKRDWHNGIDLKTQAAPIGYDATTKEPHTKIPVLAVLGGKVIKSADSDGSQGNEVIIQALDGTRHYYYHLYERWANEGDVVSEGTELGIMGTSGRSSGVHLHFEVRKGKYKWAEDKENEDSVDPAAYLGIENSIGSTKADDGSNSGGGSGGAGGGPIGNLVSDAIWNEALERKRIAEQNLTNARQAEAAAHNNCLAQENARNQSLEKQQAAEQRVRGTEPLVDSLAQKADSQFAAIEETVQTVFNAIQTEMEKYATTIFGV